LFDWKRTMFHAALAVMASAVCGTQARAANTFPKIPIWAYAGAYRDVAHSTFPYTQLCQGLGLAPLPDSIQPRQRTVTVRFLRDRVAEARSDFGGYRIYRVVNSPDSSHMELIRRYSVQAGDTLTWFMSRVDKTTLQFMCGGQVMNDSIATFLDPDSCGHYVKTCPIIDLRANRCLADSVLSLIIPPGPHNGFTTYYSVTYELFNSGAEATYEDMFVPDTAGVYGPCANPSNKFTCPNLNNKLANLTPGIEPTGGPTTDLESVMVVPNPYRATESWDQPGQHEIHFVNLPNSAKIRIYTSAGDLVRVLQHSDPTRDFERWDLKNAGGQDVASGIYMYRVEAGTFAFQSRFIVIR